MKIEGKASGVNPLTLLKGKDQRRVKNDNPQAIPKKTRARGGQSVIFMIFALSNSSNHWNEAF